MWYKIFCKTSSPQATVILYRCNDGSRSRRGWNIHSHFTLLFALNINRSLIAITDSHFDAPRCCRWQCRRVNGNIVSFSSFCTFRFDVLSMQLASWSKRKIKPFATFIICLHSRLNPWSNRVLYTVLLSNIIDYWFPRLFFLCLCWKFNEFSSIFVMMIKFHKYTTLIFAYRALIKFFKSFTIFSLHFTQTVKFQDCSLS